MQASPTAKRTLLLGLAMVALLAPLSALGTPSPASAETTSSAKTVTAKDYDPDAEHAPFPDLKVTVSQTQDLIQQGVTVSWAGGKQSTVPTQQLGGTNFLQIMQCWGDEPGSNGTRPDRTTCQYGGLDVTADQRFSYRDSPEEIAPEDKPYSVVGSTFFDPTMTAIPFVSATGVKLSLIEDGEWVKNPPSLDNNEFFTKYTTNEVAWAGNGAEGSGTVSFELQTVQQSPGLGCGTPITSGGTTSGSACWLVIVPRGTTDAGGSGIAQSGLFWETWKHHIAIRMGFKPAGLSCAIGAAERQLSGSELISSAMGQWQPKLCGSSSAAVYSLLTGPESDAALAANGTAAAPMAITSRALSTDGATDNLTYAPIALTGVSIGFAIDRLAKVSDGVPAAVLAKQRQAFTTLKLTPRLLAKLLTASYNDALPSASDKSHLSGVRNLTVDPDFLAINDPEWAYMAIASVGVSDALVPLGRSDAARAVWRYILADADAKNFLSGKADPWGMKVNPYYSTNPKVNPTKTALTLPRDDFPKADPVEFPGLASNDYADVVNLVTWRPFTASLDAGGYDVLRGDALTLGSWDPTSTPPKFSKGDRARVGLQGVIGLTDTSAAAKYQVIQASLRNPAGTYVAPSSSTIAAAAAVMTKDPDQSQVVRLDPSSSSVRDATDAYPLALPVYAAVNPAMTGADMRADYAAFISYAAGDGQTPGTDDGELPDGYAPLPAAWKTQAVAAAAAIRAGASATPSPSPTATSTSASTAGNGGPVSASPTSTSTGPSPTGAPAGTLSGSVTAADPGLGAMSAVIPATAAVGLAAALGVPLLSRLRRRQL
jgi:hypothetical protein